MATNQKWTTPVAIGVIPAQWGGTNTQSQSAAATWLGIGFFQHDAKTLNTVRVFANAVTGSLGASDLKCEVYGDSGTGTPGVSLGSSTTLAAPVGANTFIEFTGFSLALSADTQYWVVLKNVNGTPASNFPRYLWLKALNVAPLPTTFSGLTPNTRVGHSVETSVNSGGTWTNNVQNSPACRLGYSDGSYAGFACGGEQHIQGLTGSTAGEIYSTRECGVMFTTSAASAWKLRGGALILNATGTPPGAARMRLYQGTTLVATSESFQFAATAGDSWIALYFSSTITLLPNTTYRLAAGTTTGGDTSNYYRSEGYFIDTNTNSLAQLPFASASSPNNYPVATWFDGSVWAQQTNLMPAYGLLLDTDGEFAPPWPRRSAAMNGGFGG